MNKLFLSIITVFLIIGGLLIFQATRQGTSVVFLPSELQSQHAGKRLERVRVAGRVSDGPVDYQIDPKFRLSFSIIDPGKNTSEVRLPVVYDKIKPDMFAPGRDVIIDGDYDGTSLVALKLLTQCPSKYEPPTPGEAGQSYSEQAEQGEGGAPL